MEARSAGDFQTSWSGKKKWASNQRMTNQFLHMVLPYRKPMALIINVIMQVIPRHDTCHMMAKQFLNNMWRRT